MPANFMWYSTLPLMLYGFPGNRFSVQVSQSGNVFQYWSYGDYGAAQATANQKNISGMTYYYFAITV